MSETTAERTVAPKQLLALIHESDQKKTKMQSISGELGARIKEAVENGHLNRKAFGLVAQLHRQDEDKRNDNIRSIRLYLDICEEQLWSDGHVGDLADMASRGDDGEAEQMALNAERVEAGIRELPADAPNGKPKRGRPAKAKPSTEPVVVEHDGLEPFRKRGEAAFKIGKPGMIPADLDGKNSEANAYLEGWSSASKRSAEKHDAEARGEVFEDDEQSARPSVAQNDRRPAMAGAEAPGNYRVQ